MFADAGLPDLAQASQRVVAAVIRLFRVRWALLYRFDPSAGVLVCVAASGRVGAIDWAGQRLPTSAGAAGRAFSTGHPVWVADVLAEPSLKLPDAIRLEVEVDGCRAVAAVPMAGGTLQGLVVVGDVPDRVFTPHDLEMLTGFAAQAAIALEAEGLYVEAERRRRATEELARVARTLTEAVAARDVGQRVAESVVALFGVPVARVRLLQPDGMLRVIGWGGTRPEDAEAGDPIKPGFGISGRAFIEGRAVWTSDIFSDPRFLMDDEVRRRLSDTPAALGVPLRAHGEVIGSLTVTDQPGRSFSEIDAVLLQLFADHAAIAIKNAELFTRAQAARIEAEASAQALRASEARYRRAQAEAESRYLGLQGLLESTDAPIFSVDAEFRYTSFNSAHAAAMKSLYGVEIRPGTSILSFLTEDAGDQAIRANLTRALRGESFTVELKARAPTLEDRWLELTHSPIRDAAGNLQGVAVFTKDVTERRRADEEIRRLNADLERRVATRTAQLTAANKELEAFAYSVSHDLRAPLRAIDGFSRLLAEDHAPHLPDVAQGYLRRIRDATRGMGQLIDGLLELSRLGRQELTRQIINSTGLVSHVIDELVTDRAGRQVEFVVGDLPTCRADPLLLKQVFVNLISNALKFTRLRATARIEVGSEEQGDQRVWFVRDNGVGFHMRHAGKLFGVFQRLHRKEDYEGTGVGLAIVQHIIQRHGGRIWAEAEPDGGAAFYFVLGEEAYDV
jgi:PAS domain S-box-containing protein